MQKDKETVTRYFITKCAQFSDLRQCVKTGNWACRNRTKPPHPPEILAQAYQEGMVMLIFSVNNQHGWHGYAIVKSTPKVDADAADQPDAWHHFRVIWVKQYCRDFGERCLSTEATRDMVTLDGDPVNQARNFQEVSTETGERICTLILGHYGKLQAERKQRDQQKAVLRGPGLDLGPGPMEDAVATGHASSSTAGIASTSAHTTTQGAPSVQSATGVLSEAVVWARLIQHVEKMGTVIVAAVFGSQRYNLSLPTSDVDMMVVYAASTRSVLGFDPPKPFVKSTEHEPYDYTVYELHKFASLLRSGDPKCIEMLFIEPCRLHHFSQLWLDITQHKHYALNAMCVDKYLSDATGFRGTKLLDRFEKLGETQKDPMPIKVNKVCYVVLRLLQNACEVCNEQMNLYRADNSEERKIIMAVRRKEMSYTTCKEHIDRLLSLVRNRRLEMSKDADKQKQEQWQLAVERWLMDIRYADFKQDMEEKQD